MREVTHLPSRPAKGELLTLNWIAMVGSSMVMRGSGCGFFEVAEALADGDAGNAGDGDDVADLGLVDVGALEAGEAEELGDLVLGECAVDAGDVVLLAGAHGAVEDAADGEAAEVVGVVEVGDEDLQRARRDRPWRRGWCWMICSKSGCRSVPGVARSRVAVPSLPLV